MLMMDDISRAIARLLGDAPAQFKYFTAMALKFMRLQVGEVNPTRLLRRFVGHVLYLLPDCERLELRINGRAVKKYIRPAGHGLNEPKALVR